MITVVVALATACSQRSLLSSALTFPDDQLEGGCESEERVEEVSLSPVTSLLLACAVLSMPRSWLVACVGGGSNAIGLFHPFLADHDVAMYGVEAGGKGVSTGEHAAPLSAGIPGVLHGNRTYLMQDENGQIMHTHSVSAGLDYPGVGPEHAWLKDIGRVNYVDATDTEALAAFHRVTRVEGIMPALETAHALAYAEKLAATMTPDQHIIVNLSGRGDKDILTVAEIDGIELGTN